MTAHRVASAVTAPITSVAPEPTSQGTGPAQYDAIILEPLGLVREGLRLLLEGDARCRVTGLAATLEEALGYIRRSPPDLAIIGLDRSFCAGVNPVAEVVAAAPSARVLAVTGAPDPAPRVAAMRAGAHGVVGLERSSQELLGAIARVLEGGYAFEPALVPHLLRAPTGGPTALLDGLTPRERQVVLLVSEGLRNKQVAARLQISDITVRHHLTSAFAKLGVDDRVEMVLKVTRRA